MPSAQKTQDPSKSDSPVPVHVQEFAQSPMKQHLVVSDDGGNLVVHDDVVAKIVGLSAREIEGVYALAPFGASDRIVAIADRITGSEHRDIGVRVSIGTVECGVDVRIVCEYGADIPSIAKEIRSKVAARIRAMTGLTMRYLNLEVVDLYFGDDGRTIAGRGLR